MDDAPFGTYDPDKAMVNRVMPLLSTAEADKLRAARIIWPNGCDKTVPEALRFLANHDRPQGGEQDFNSAHLYQLAAEIERAVLATTPETAKPDTSAAGYRWRVKAEFNGPWGPGAWVLSSYGPSDIDTLDVEPVYSASTIGALSKKLDEARGLVTELEEALDAQAIKLEALAPHGSCACSYDKPNDVCLHHSPQLVKANARIKELEEEREQELE